MTANTRPDQLDARRPRGNGELRAYAAAAGRTMKDLLVLAPANDPFNKGTATDRRNAAWFAELHGGQEVRHLRRLHYVALSLEITRPDGTRYENTDACWNLLCTAASAARALRLIDPALIVDARNPDPKIHFEARPTPTPEVYVDNIDDWHLPSLHHQLDPVSFEMPEADVFGYDWEPGDEPVHVEVWVEKTTMDDVLVPLCRRLNVNYRSGPGFASITNTVDLVRRAARDRPVRVFYISDYDPAGVTMPRAVARQVEYWADDDLDIALTPLVLTRNQVNDFALPRTPIKDTDRRRGNFEATNGAGAVELDALEALHPGQLAMIVDRAVAEHRDQHIHAALAHAARAAEGAAAASWQAITGDLRDELAGVEADVNAALDRYRAELSDLSERLGRDLAEPNERLRQLRHALDERAAALAVALPTRPIPQTPADHRPWLYHSRRPWLDQLLTYRQWQP